MRGLSLLVRCIGNGVLGVRHVQRKTVVTAVREAADTAAVAATLAAARHVGTGIW